MIKSVTVRNFLGESIKMELTNPWDTGLLITSIDGLGPSKASINVTEISGADGGEYNSARVESKNIVLSLQFLGDDIESIRQSTYKYFPVKKQLTLTIETDNRTASIDGYVESNEPDIFSENEGCQISIICPFPYFYSDDNITVFRGIDQLFEFPYSNESLEAVTIFGEFENHRYRNIKYTGDVDTGITMLLHCLGHVENVKIINTTSREIMFLDTSKIAAMFGTEDGLTTGDDVMINTVRGQRYITLYRGGQYYNILNCLPRGTDWVGVYKGDNVFAYSAEVGLDNLEFRILNKVLYGGM